MSESPTAESGRTVLLLGTLDTKGEEFEFLRDRLRGAGAEVLLADVGTLEPPRVQPDITREEVGAATGVDVAGLDRKSTRLNSSHSSPSRMPSSA